MIHNEIANTGIDSYTVALSSSPVTDGSTGVAEVGGGWCCVANSRDRNAGWVRWGCGIEAPFG